MGEDLLKDDYAHQNEKDATCLCYFQNILQKIDQPLPKLAQSLGTRVSFQGLLQVHLRNEHRVAMQSLDAFISAGLWTCSHFGRISTLAGETK